MVIPEVGAAIKFLKPLPATPLHCGEWCSTRFLQLTYGVTPTEIRRCTVLHQLDTPI